MRPAIKLSQGWLDARGWSLAEGTALLEIDQANAVAAGTDDACPKCERPNSEYQGWAFVPDPASANSEHERGCAYILCICGALYWYAAVDVLNAPTEDVRVRSAASIPTSTTIEPGTGSLQIEGQTPETEIGAPAPPVLPEPLPPGVFVGTPPVRYKSPWYRASQYFNPSPELDVPVRQQLDESNWVARYARDRQRRFYITAGSIPSDAAGPLRPPKPQLPGQCPLCRIPLGPLDRTEIVNGLPQHVQPCPKPARPTGERMFPWLPKFS